MAAREEILRRLQEKQRTTPFPDVWQSRREFDDLAARFSQSLTAVLGEVRRATGWDNALQQVGLLLTELDAQKIVVNSAAPLTTIDFAARWPDIEWHVVGQSEGNLRAFCEAADVGISGADAALAETGSIIVSSGPGKSRLATLLPPVHLALVPISRLTTDIFTWTAVRQGKMPANVIMISGPSKTADIEQTMAVGVHGPKRLIVVLYDG